MTPQQAKTAATTPGAIYLFRVRVTAPHPQAATSFVVSARLTCATHRQSAATAHVSQAKQLATAGQTVARAMLTTHVVPLMRVVLQRLNTPAQGRVAVAALACLATWTMFAMLVIGFPDQGTSPRSPDLLCGLSDPVQGFLTL